MAEFGFYHQLQARVKKLGVYFRSSENTRLLGMAVAVGILTGLGVWGFRTAIEGFHILFYALLYKEILYPVVGPVGIIIELVLAGIIVGLIMQRFVGEERHHGVAGIMESVALAGGRLPYRLMPFKAFASALSIGAGASVGPEDPSVQIGSNLGSWLGQIFSVDEEQVRTLVAAGAAGAISAAFKAPIAGVFFALEVILVGSFATSSVSVIILASVVSSTFVEAIDPGVHMGPFAYELGSALEIPLFIPLGIIFAPIAVLFTHSVYWQRDLWQRFTRLSRPYKTALAAILIGTVGIFVPEVLGSGLEPIESVLSGEAGFALSIVMLIGFTKLVITGVSAGGGFVGGLFAPTLFIGTMLGSAYGLALHQISPFNIVAQPEAFAIVGMASMLAGVVRSPITAILMVFEMTNDYRLILPIMLSTVMCMLIADYLEPSGVYHMGLVRHGIYLRGGTEIDVMQSVTVGEAMLKPAPAIEHSASLQTLRDTLRRFHSRSLVVLDKDSLLCGVVTLSDLQRSFEANGISSTLTVGDICSRQVITAEPNDLVWTAIKRMSTYDIGRLVVVEPGTRRVVGLIGRHGVIRAYNIAISRKLQEQHTAEKVRLNMLTGGHTVEIRLHNRSFITGKLVRDVTWPPDCVVASIQRKGKLLIPNGNTTLQVDDHLTIICDPDMLDELAALTGERVK